MYDLAVSNPWVLLAIPAGFAGLYLILRLKFPDKAQRLRAFAVRGAIITFAILALAGVTGTFGAKRALAVFVFDVSDSCVGSYQEAAQSASRILATLEPDDRAAIVYFGARTVVHSAATSARSVSIPDTPPVEKGLGDFTDLASAIERAADIASSAGEAGRIYLYTDARVNLNAERLNSSILRARTLGIRVFPVALRGLSDDLVSIASIRAPESVHPAEPFYLDVLVIAAADLKSEFVVRVPGQESRRTVVQLLAGGSSIRLPIAVAEEGLQEIAVSCNPEGAVDPFTENNEIKTAVRSGVLPRVVWISSATDAPPGAALLAATGKYAVKIAAPKELEGELSGADLIALDDVSSSALGERVIGLLDASLKSGKGLLALGGRSGFGAGGYAGTALERMLPVWPDPRERKSISLTLLIDASGSMGEEISDGKTKFTSALLAALPLVDEMKEQDKLGIITFSVLPVVQMPLSALSDKKSANSLLRGKILREGPGGGTDIYAALDAAFGELRKSDRGLRHVILISDGKSRPGKFDAAAFREARVTVSTIATDSNPDRRVLEDIANSSGGKFYMVSDLGRALADVFIKDLRTIPGALTREGASSMLAQGAAARAFGGLPEVSGFDLTAPKESAVVEIAAQSGETLLAHWNYGAGRSAAFMPGLGVWAGNIFRWSGARSFVKMLADLAMPRLGKSGWRMERVLEQRGLRLVFSAENDIPLLQSRVYAVITPPGADSTEFPAVQTAPGVYETTIPVTVEGLHTIRLVRDIGSAPAETLASTFYYYDLAMEKRITGPDAAAIAEIAQFTGGRVLGPGDAPPAGDARRAAERADLSWIFIFAVLAAFLLDLALGAFVKIIPNNSQFQ
jgi:hypothetical protein